MVSTPWGITIDFSLPHSANATGPIFFSPDGNFTVSILPHFAKACFAILVTVYGLIAEIIVCLGYNKLYMEVKLPNGTVGQILDIMDYVSNNVLMPIVALATCILIGWIASPKVIIDEVTRGGSKFTRKGLYIIMVKFIAPAFLLILLLQALGIVSF